MKKIVSLVLALLMVFGLVSLTSCLVTPAAAVEQAFENTEKLDSYYAVMDFKLSLSATGVTVDLPMSFEYKVEDANSENPTVYAKSNIEMLGQSLTVESYLKDGWAYIIYDGEKAKVNLSKVENDDEYEYEFIEEFVQEIPEELLKNVEFTNEDDGGKTVNINIPDSTFNELYDDFLEMITETALQEEFKNLVFSEADLSVTIKDGYVNVYSMEYNMSFNSDNVPMNASVEVSLEYKNPGEKVSVTMPKGYESFDDITSVID